MEWLIFSIVILALLANELISPVISYGELSSIVYVDKANKAMKEQKRQFDMEMEARQNA